MPVAPPTAAELVASLEGLSVEAIRSDDGHPVGVVFAGSTGRAELVADLAGSGWPVGAVLRESGLAPDGTLTLIAAHTALVVRPSADGEAWLLLFDSPKVALICRPGGEIARVEQPAGLLARLRGLIRR